MYSDVVSIKTDGVAGGRARNRRGEGERLSRDIVEAATALLDETGSAAGVTLRAVARRVGITAPAIYPHFGDPQAILLAVVQEEFGRLREHLRAALDAAPDDSVARLEAWCHAYLQYARDRPHRYAVLFGGVWKAERAVQEETVAPADVSELGRDTLDDLTGALRRCVDEGRSGSTDPGADAVALWVGLHGLAHQRIMSTAFPWPPALDERLITHLALLRPRPDGPPATAP